jgi:DNA mismatch endonuclease (patch repair protein)
MDTKTPDQRSANMRMVRASGTKLEIQVRKYLHANGLRFLIAPHGLIGKPDVVLPRFRSVVFANGCFWHGHANCRASKLPSSIAQFWEQKITRNISRDHFVHSELTQQGWRVNVIWGCELSASGEALPRLLESILHFARPVQKKC